MDIPGLKLDLGSLDGLGTQTNRPVPGKLYDLLILGGGPAAMSATIYAARKMLDLAVVTKDFGGQVAVTSEIENYLGFQSITGQELTDRFAEQVRLFEVPTAKGERVVKVQRRPDGFTAQLESGTSYAGRTVILATGKRDKLLNVPGEQALIGKGVAFCAICDAPFYKDRRVVVVGGGNSGFTAALDLVKNNATVTLVNHSPGFKADEIMRENLDRQPSPVTYLDDHRVLEIVGGDKVEGIRLEHNPTGEQKLVPTDGVFVEIGLLPNSEPVRELAALNRFGELIIDCECRTDVDGLFGSGDVTTVPEKQIIISAGEGAKAALAAYDHLTRSGLL